MILLMIPVVLAVWLVTTICVVGAFAIQVLVLLITTIGEGIQCARNAARY